MKVLLDTNIVIHREAAAIINEDIGILFKWLDNLHYSKCIHPLTAEELGKYHSGKTKKTMELKLANYNVLKTIAPLADEVRQISERLDNNQNDKNDTLILNELYQGRVDALITEDKKIIIKATLLNIADRVYSIDTLLEKVTAENPEQADYKILSVQKDYFGNIDPKDDFFTSMREDYPDFEKWLRRKADETIYICRSENKPIALLYLKIENETENYSDIYPQLSKKRRLKIGTFKVALNGYRLGERFLKIIFDNALRFNVDEIYVTTFDRRIDQQRLSNLIEEYGFHLHGRKKGQREDELVYVRSFARIADPSNPKMTYPFLSAKGNIFIVPIYPAYHTELFPDSILRTESPDDYKENEPYRNAISKVYISRSIERNVKSGDIIIFYRTGGFYEGVVTTLGIAEGVIDRIPSEAEFIHLCRKRSVFNDMELSKQWNYKKYNRPFIVNFLYAYSFPKRINLKRLIEIGVISDLDHVPRGFTMLSKENLNDILQECKADESIIVD